MAVLHPLAQPLLSSALRLRHIRGRGQDGSLSAVTHLPHNAVVWFTEQTEETIVASARSAVGDALARCPVRPALVFDCAARKRALGDRLADEVSAIRRAFAADAPLGGLFTRGEVGRTRGAKGDLNHAIVVVAFGR